MTDGIYTYICTCCRWKREGERGKGKGEGERGKGKGERGKGKGGVKGLFKINIVLLLDMNMNEYEDAEVLKKDQN